MIWDMNVLNPVELFSIIRYHISVAITTTKSGTVSI